MNILRVHLSCSSHIGFQFLVPQAPVLGTILLDLISVYVIRNQERNNIHTFTLLFIVFKFLCPLSSAFWLVIE